MDCDGLLWFHLLQGLNTVRQTASCVGGAGVLMLTQPRFQTVDNILIIIKSARKIQVQELI